MTSLLALATMSSVTVAPSGFDRARLNLIPVRMKEAVERKQVPGNVVLVRERGRTVLFDARGFARLEPATPMRKDTIFQVMSMTKPIVAMAAMILVERGQLRLDDRVDRWLPAFKELTVREADGRVRPFTKGPTVRQLMTHTAGFGGDDPAGITDEIKRGMELGPYVDRLPEAPLVAEAGERIRYSGLGFSTLGRIVELASGKPLQEFMQEAIFDPLGMRDTSFFLPEAKRSRVAWTYSTGDKVRPFVPVETNPYREGAKLANPAGGLYSTAEDMARLMDCLVNGGSLKGRRVLSPAGVQALTTVATGEMTMDGSDAQGYGMGFVVVRSAAGQNALKPIGSFGHVGAFGTEFWADRERGVVAVYMAQTLDYDPTPRKTFNTLVNAAYVRR